MGREKHRGKRGTVDRKNRNTGQKKGQLPRKSFGGPKNTFKKDLNKRKTKYEEENKTNREPKRQKLEEKPPVQQAEVEFSSSESENETDYFQLLSQKLAEKCGKNTSRAVDTSEESDSEIENDGVIASKSENLDDSKSDSNGSDTEGNDEDSEIEEDVEQQDQDLEDPFVKHFSRDLHKNLLESLQAAQPVLESHTLNWPQLGEIQVQIPKVSGNETVRSGTDTNWAPAGQVPRKIDLDKIKMQTEHLFIKSQISGHLKKANPTQVVGDDRLFTPFQAELFSIINNYQDFLYCERDFENGEDIRFVYCLHAVNHVVKTRTNVLRNNARLTKKGPVEEESRDQGFVRPKVLILLPFRDAAYRVVRKIVDILLIEDKGNVINKKRLIAEFTGNELTMPKKHPKPEDFVQTFKGNTEDDFRIGLKVTNKSLKLYADFYSADILVASPLGLRTIIGSEGESKRDYDFLASIELLILDQTDVFLMQNWDHLVHVMDHMHLQPKTLNTADINRIRQWSLEGLAKYYRQTLIFSSVRLPAINSIFNRCCHNYAGKVRVVNAVEYGAINEVKVRLMHVFRKFEASSPVQAVQARFDFFINTVLPNHQSKQTLIFVPSYYDFIKLRNHFNKEDVDFVQICEYTKEGKVARARDMFYHGDARFLLYTERYHFYNRIRTKGIRHLIFFQPPNYPHFYDEMCNLMHESNLNKKIGDSLYPTVTVIYCKYDSLQLVDLMGTERAAKMLESDSKIHTMKT